MEKSLEDYLLQNGLSDETIRVLQQEQVVCRALHFIYVHSLKMWKIKTGYLLKKCYLLTPNVQNLKNISNNVCSLWYITVTFCFAAY